MKCQDFKYHDRILSGWHSFFCAECRAARGADRLTARGITQMQGEPSSDAGMARTLQALGLSAGAVGSARAVGRRGPALVTTRRVLLGAGLAVLGVFLGTAFLGRSETRVLAETLAAMAKASSFHFKETGFWPDGREIRSETWYSHGRTRIEGDRLIVIDDGQESRMYQRGSQVVRVDRSFRERIEPLGSPGGFLRQTLADKRSYNPKVRWEQRRERDARGNELTRIDIFTPGKGESPSRDPYSESWFILWVDPRTHLPLRWEERGKQKQGGQWQLIHRVGPIEFNHPIPDRIFRDPLPGNRQLVEFDERKRAEGSLTTRVAASGERITLRALYLSQEEDVIVIFAPWGEAKARVNPDFPASLERFRDDRGTEYVPMREIQFHSGSSVETRLTPLAPRGGGDPRPRQFSFTLKLKNGEEVEFRDLPAPRPPYASVREFPDYSFTNGKPAGYLEAQRQKARAEYRALKGART